MTEKHILCQKIAELAKEKQVLKAVLNTTPISYIPFRMMVEPFKISREEFQLLKAATHTWQKLVYLTSFDSKLLIQIFSKIQHDDMIQSMLGIYQDYLTLEKQSSRIKPTFEFYRTDYFLTNNERKLIQYNNAAVSMAGISQRYQEVFQEIYKDIKQIPENKSLGVYSRSINDFYVQNSLSGIMLLVCQSDEINLKDQTLLISEIEKYGIFQVKRIMIEQLDKRTSLSENGDLYFQEKEKVAIVYYRAAYKPSEYSENCKIAKRKVQMSNAVPIPWIGAELAGQKRFQAQISKKEVMLKYLTKDEADLIFSTVIPTWDFKEEDETEVKKMIQFMESQNPENFVLKPNAEGGMNNFFGNEAFEKFKSLTKDEWPNFILTNRIIPRKTQTLIIKQSDERKSLEIENCEADSEVSIFGVAYGNNQGLKCNISDGFLIRSKPKHVNEGGLMSGTGAITALEIVQNI